MTRQARKSQRFYPSAEEARRYHELETSGKDKAVYVIEVGPFVKVGVTSDPWSRFSALESYGDTGRAYITRSTKHARRIEALSHESLADDRARGEFFRATFETAVSVVRRTGREWGIR